MGICRGEMSGKPKTARSYRGSIIDDNAVLSINIKFLANVFIVIGGLVYGYWKIETRITDLENKMVDANEQIGGLLDRHIVEERTERQQLAEKVAFYEKEFNINPFSWKKKKRK
jgi:hypothetical protein|tara:strand:- start:1507 stop:1848 length:342 start_codon:yes stop_codon:yes gene_type:complete